MCAKSGPDSTKLQAIQTNWLCQGQVWLGLAKSGTTFSKSGRIWAKFRQAFQRFRPMLALESRQVSIGMGQSGV